MRVNKRRDWLKRVLGMSAWSLLGSGAVHAQTPGPGERLLAGHDQADGCIVVRPDHPIQQSFDIKAPGNYCVQENFVQRWVLTLPHGKMPFPSGRIIDVMASDVVLDLGKHKLSAEEVLGKTIKVGVHQVAEGHNLSYGRVLVRNGVIDIPRGLPIYLTQTGGFNLKGPRKEFLFYGKGIDLSDGAPDFYKDTEYILEDLTIVTKSHAVILQGAKNILRRCRIIGCDGVVQLFGPNVQLIDCEIVLGYHNPFNFSSWKELPVALWLEDADNAVLSGNRFVINTEQGRNLGYAVALKNSTNVRFQNNTVNGVPALYKSMDDSSTASETGTEHITRPTWPWWLTV